LCMASTIAAPLSRNAWPYSRRVWAPSTSVRSRLW
jgi:hypothetical protein